MSTPSPPGSELRPPDAARPRVLLVDDDELFRESLGHNLMDAGFSVVEAAAGAAALDRLAADRSIGLVLLDWQMPGMNGIEVLRRMREQGLAVPVIFLTMLGDQIYEEAALQGGAVDFVDKARSFSILLKRIALIGGGLKGGAAAPVRGGQGQPAGEPGLRRGPLELRRASHRVFWRGIEVGVSVTEFRMIDLLASKAGQDIGYRELYDLVHGPGFAAGAGAEGYRANLRAFVKRMRRKFRDLDESFDAIESSSGFGYRWREEESRDP